MRRSIGTLAIAAALTGCDIAGLDDIALDGSLTASPVSASVGQQVEVTLEAEGTRLLSLFIDYDDGSDPDFLNVAGSRSARWTRTHTFDSAGTYEIFGRVDEVTDTLTRTVTVTVTDPAPRPARIPAPFAEVARQ